MKRYRCASCGFEVERWLEPRVCPECSTPGLVACGGDAEQTPSAPVPVRAGPPPPPPPRRARGQDERAGGGVPPAAQRGWRGAVARGEPLTTDQRVIRAAELLFGSDRGAPAAPPPTPAPVPDPGGEARRRRFTRPGGWNQPQPSASRAASPGRAAAAGMRPGDEEAPGTVELLTAVVGERSARRDVPPERRPSARPRTGANAAASPPRAAGSAEAERPAPRKRRRVTTQTVPLVKTLGQRRRRRVVLAVWVIGGAVLAFGAFRLMRGGRTHEGATSGGSAMWPDEPPSGERAGSSSAASGATAVAGDRDGGGAAAAERRASAAAGASSIAQQGTVGADGQVFGADGPGPAPSHERGAGVTSSARRTSPGRRARPAARRPGTRSARRGARTSRSAGRRANKPAKTAPTKSPAATTSPPAAAKPAKGARDLYRKGLRRLLVGDQSSAVALFKRAVARDRRLGAAYRGLGLAYQKLGKRSLARKAFRRYLAIEPGAPDAARIRQRIHQLE